MSESRVITKFDDSVAYVTLNRPEKLNGVDLELIAELIAAGESLRDNRTIRAIILQGEGRSFCSGLDFAAAFKNKKKVARYFLAGPRATNTFQKVNAIWRELPVPVIAVIRGHCFGAGLQLAVNADFRFTTPDAQWSVLEAKWGLVPDMAGTPALAELLPTDVAMRLTMTGEIFSGTQAAEFGLATGVAEDPLVPALDLVDKISERSPDSVAASKQLIYRTRRGSLRSIFRAERRLQGKMFKSPNTAAAREAGLTKAEPQFKPRTFG